MNKVRKNKSVWGSRITNETSYNFKKFGASIDVYKRLFRTSCRSIRIVIGSHEVNKRKQTKKKTGMGV